MTLNQPLISPNEIATVMSIIPSTVLESLVEVIPNSDLFTSDTLQSIFSPTEITRAASYTNEKRKAEYLGGRYATKMLLTKSLPSTPPLHLITIDTDQKGAPFVRIEANAPFEHGSLADITPLLTSRMISLTHKAGTIVAIIASQASVDSIGIDLEYRVAQRTIDKAKDRMIAMIGTLEESSLVENGLVKVRQNQETPLTAPNETDAFLALFSIKEAAYKALRGEATTLKKIVLDSFYPDSISGYELPCFRSTLRYNGHRLEALSIELRDFLMSVAWW